MPLKVGFVGLGTMGAPHGAQPRRGRVSSSRSRRAPPAKAAGARAERARRRARPRRDAGGGRAASRRRRLLPAGLARGRAGPPRRAGNGPRRAARGGRRRLLHDRRGGRARDRGARSRESGAPLARCSGLGRTEGSDRGHADLLRRRRGGGARDRRGRSSRRWASASRTSAPSGAGQLGKATNQISSRATSWPSPRAWRSPRKVGPPHRPLHAALTGGRGELLGARGARPEDDRPGLPAGLRDQAPAEGPRDRAPDRARRRACRCPARRPRPPAPLGPRGAGPRRRRDAGAPDALRDDEQQPA